MTLGIAVIGQAPRFDIADLFGVALPAGGRITLRGCLDGLSDAEVDALRPRDGADTLYTRLRGERDVKISKAVVIARAPEVLARLCSEGCEAIVFACTGEFPPLLGDAGVVFPSRVLSALKNYRSQRAFPGDIVVALRSTASGLPIHVRGRSGQDDDSANHREGIVTSTKKKPFWPAPQRVAVPLSG